MMQDRKRVSGFGAALLAAVMGLSLAIAPGASAAQGDHRTFTQRHPILTGAAAGYGTYRLSKHTGRARRWHHRHRNFAQRHPVLTGAAVAVGAHHWAKKHQ